MEDIHPSSIDMREELFIKTDFQVEDVEYNWIKKEIKKEDINSVVMDNTSDTIKEETGNSEIIKQDPANYCSCLDVKPVVFKQELSEVGNETQRLSLWNSDPTDAVISTEHSSKDIHTLTTSTTDLLAVEMKYLGLLHLHFS